MQETSQRNPHNRFPNITVKTTLRGQNSDLLIDSQNGSLSARWNYINEQFLSTPFSPFSALTSSTTYRRKITIQQGYSPSITDRYIPSRKLLNKDSLTQVQQIRQNDQNQTNLKPPSIPIVADFYKQYVMNIKSDQSGFSTFRNTNLLKFGQSNFINQQNIQITPKQLKFNKLTQQIQKKTKNKRVIPKFPCKVLDSPQLQDDYYLNLIDWSYQNLVSVALGPNIYIYDASIGQAKRLCTLGITDTITSVTFSKKDPKLAIGTSSGQIQIWDVNTKQVVQTMKGHMNRVSAISWATNILATGSKDKSILQNDLRTKKSIINFQAHTGQVCGLKWSPSQQQLASGANDNKLIIWNPGSKKPYMKFADHTAAVKAVAWSPHQHGVLISGGGTADRTIRFRNTLTGKTTKVFDTKSQVCNLLFSKSVNQIVSTHGFSQQQYHNQINIWKYPKMTKIATLKGHVKRVLYLAMSPDGSTIATGAGQGDQTIRFWKIFPAKHGQNKQISSQLTADNVKIR